MAKRKVWIPLGYAIFSRGKSKESILDEYLYFIILHSLCKRVAPFSSKVKTYTSYKSKNFVSTIVKRWVKKDVYI